MISHLDRDGGCWVEQNIDARSKLDQTNPLPALHTIANLLCKNNPACQQASNLLKDHDLALALDRHDVLLILLSRGRIHGIDEPSLLIPNLTNDAIYRRKVYVHVENVQKYTDAKVRNAIRRNRPDRSDLAVRRRYQRPRCFGNDSFWIAEEPQEESSQQHSGCCP